MVRPAPWDLLVLLEPMESTASPVYPVLRVLRVNRLHCPREYSTTSLWAHMDQWVRQAFADLRERRVPWVMLVRQVRLVRPARWAIRAHQARPDRRDPEATLAFQVMLGKTDNKAFRGQLGRRVHVAISVRLASTDNLAHRVH